MREPEPGIHNRIKTSRGTETSFDRSEHFFRYGILPVWEDPRVPFVDPVTTKRDLHLLKEDCYIRWPVSVKSPFPNPTKSLSWYKRVVA